MSKLADIWNLPTCRRVRMINYLRTTYPNFTWSYDRATHRWTSPDTDYSVGSYSELNNSYDGDESSHIAFIDSNGQHVFLPYKPIRKKRS